MLLSVYTGISLIPVARLYLAAATSAANFDGDAAFITTYGLLIGSIYGFYTSLFYKDKDTDLSIRQWPVGRFYAWPLLLLSYGIYKILSEAYGI